MMLKLFIVIFIFTLLFLSPVYAADIEECEVKSNKERKVLICSEEEYIPLNEAIGMTVSILIMNQCVDDGVLTNNVSKGVESKEDCKKRIFNSIYNLYKMRF